MTTIFKSMLICAVIGVASCAGSESIKLSNDCRTDYDCPENSFCSSSGQCLEKMEGTAVPVYIQTQNMRRPGDNRLDLCDGQDNDNDGFTDENDPNVMQDCIALVMIEGNLVHVQSHLACSSMGLVCATPSIETCQLNAEVCSNGLDDNCNGLEEEGCNNSEPVDNDKDNDGYSPADGDCDDNNHNVSPAAIEYCDSIDNNCDGQTDESDPQEGLFCIDLTTINGNVVPVVGLWACKPASDIRCEFSPELCRNYEICDNGLDDTCNGVIDDGCDQSTVSSDCDDNDPCTHDVPTSDGVYLWCTHIMICDEDGDGQVNSQNGGADCDDNDPSVGMWFQELCDGKDNDCDSLVDEGCCPEGYQLIDDACFPIEQGVPCNGGYDPYVGSECEIVYCLPSENSEVCEETVLQGSWICGIDGYFICQANPNTCTDDYYMFISANTPSGMSVPSIEMKLAELWIVAMSDDMYVDSLTFNVASLVSYPDNNDETWVLRDKATSEVIALEIQDITGDENGQVEFILNPPAFIAKTDELVVEVYADTTEMSFNDMIQLYTPNPCGDDIYAGALLF